MDITSHSPFLPRFHHDSVPALQADIVVVTNVTQMRNLHKDIFYIPDLTLAFIGVPYYTATFSLFEFQAIAVAAVFSGKVPLPKEDEARKEYEERVRKKGFGRAFHSLKGLDKVYVKELLEWVNLWIMARGEKPIEGHSEEWKAKYEAMKETQGSKALLEVKSNSAEGKERVSVLAEAVEPIEVH